MKERATDLPGIKGIGMNVAGLTGLYTSVLNGLEKCLDLKRCQNTDFSGIQFFEGWSNG
ncbi:MAG: hypothetical protein HXS46_04450 [Theionarchaea archaeon]|nr:hypothetical protein [Theionarchaea archaeon]